MIIKCLKVLCFLILYSCIIKRKAVPFDISLPTYSDELEDALKETIEIEKEYKSGKRKGYNNINEMMESILDD